MMGIPSTAPRLLRPEDEYLHPVGPASNWSESRYADFCDLASGVSGWVRHGFRVNEGVAEVTVCLHLPGGEVAFGFARVPVDGNGLAAGGLEWALLDPYLRLRVTYTGELTMLPDGLALGQPRRAFAEGVRVPVRLSLTLSGAGLRSVLGADQSEIGRILLPGQAEGHYQQLMSVTGAVWVGERIWPIDGCGGRDHSWGPRNWHAKRWFRWLVGSVDPGFGFMLTRAVGPHARTAGGMVWADGRRHLVDRLVVRTEHAGSYPVATTASFRRGHGVDGDRYSTGDGAATPPQDAQRRSAGGIAHREVTDQMGAERRTGRFGHHRAPRPHGRRRPGGWAGVRDLLRSPICSDPLGLTGV